MSDPNNIMIVEDDEQLALLVAEYLEAKGFNAMVHERGDTAVAAVLEHIPDLVILDIMLPGLDGLEVCRRLRPLFAGPILMLTALDDEIDEVVGLEIGADDYMAKPVRPRLLVARINALLRRGLPVLTENPRLEVGDLVLDPTNREVRRNDAVIELTDAEFDLLAFLMARVGQTVPRDDIYSELRGIEYDGIDRSIDLRVARLRKKIGDDAKSPAVIKSVRGVGYLLVPGDG